MKNILPSDIVAEWGLSKLSDELQLEMVERIGRIIYQALLVKSLDVLTEKEQEEFDKLLDIDTTTPDDVLAFLQKKIPNFEKIVLEERNKLKNELLITV